MSSIKEDTIGGFNTFLGDQQDEQGTATVSLFEFNTNVGQIYQWEPIDDAPRLSDATYTPSGRTALHDAIFFAIDDTRNQIASLDAENRPDYVIVVVLTDGKENASETPQDRVREQVKKCREKFNWEFLFIGSNQDAALTASKMGMGKSNSLDMAHNSDGMQAAYESTSDRIRDARREGKTGGFDETDRDRQDEAGNR
jgi:uncharacterized protein YegL